MAEDNKNSFRDMILIIFVVLVCFGITIYGIAYLTGKVFSGSSEVKVPTNERPKEVTTNPNEGDTLTFTSIEEPSDEVTPNEDNIRTIITPPKQNTLEVVDNDTNIIDPIPAPVINEESPKTVINEPIKEQKEVKNETVTNAEKTKEDKKIKQEPQQKPIIKQAEPKKETVKTAPPTQTGMYVVQLLAVQSKEAAEKEANKYRNKYPDVFIKQVVIDGKTWYRVRLGVSATKEQAQQKANKIAQEFKIKPIVTKNN